MPLIRLPGETLGRHAGFFSTRRGLQDVKEVEADRLLDLERAALRAFLSNTADPDVAAAPEIVHVLLLSSEQLLETLAHHPIHGPLGTTTQFFRGSGRRRVIDHALGEIDRTVGQRFNRENDLAEVLGVSSLVGVLARGL